MNALSTQLSWTHLRELAAIENDLKRTFYTELSVKEKWSTRTLNERIGSLLYERTALSKKPELLLPVIIVLLSALGSTIINPRYIDARIYAPVGALLTAVFLEQSTSSKLPDISYLTLIDKIYLIVYITILTGIFHAIYTANLVKDSSEVSFAKAKRFDKIYLAIVAVLLLLSPMLFLL